jgi:tyrosyl-tRNA synthetase
MVKKIEQNITPNEELLSRSISKVYPSKKELLDKLNSGKKLRIYVGIDPTADYVHLGHSTNYYILKRFWENGHKIIVLIGDFTARIGDPSDKTSTRRQLSTEEVLSNLASFKSQISKILPLDSKDNPIEFRFNSEWLSELKFETILELCSNFTVNQIIERDMYQKRLASNLPLYLHEWMYVVMQAYDSVALDVDIEIGGTDQMFNMLAGRTLMKKIKNKEKFVITTTLLTNPISGEKLMSKSLGTGISIKDTPNVMFEKIMRLPDEALLQLYLDCTELSLTDIKTIKDRIASGENPKYIKLELANYIVEKYHDIDSSKSANAYWVNKYSKLTDKEELDPLYLGDSKIFILAVLANKLFKSKGEVSRLVSQGAVRINNKVISDVNHELTGGDIVRIGKKHHLRAE